MTSNKQYKKVVLHYQMRQDIAFMQHTHIHKYIPGMFPWYEVYQDKAHTNTHTDTRMQTDV